MAKPNGLFPDDDNAVPRYARAARKKTKKAKTKSTRPKPAVNADDLNWARKFQNRINAATNIDAPPNPQEFRRLRSIVKDDAPRIAAVLDWWLDNHADPYTPRVFCASDFREKFAALEDARRRWRDENLPESELTPLARKILQTLRTFLLWPKGSDSQLPAAVQCSLDNYLEFIRRRDAVYRAALPDSSLRRFGERLRADMLFPEDFVQRWFEGVNHRIHNWDKWRGGLGMFVFTVDHKDFQATMEGYAVEYNGNPRPWELYSKECADAD